MQNALLKLSLRKRLVNVEELRTGAIIFYGIFRRLKKMTNTHSLKKSFDARYLPMFAAMRIEISKDQLYL